MSVRNFVVAVLVAGLILTALVGGWALSVGSSGGEDFALIGFLALVLAGIPTLLAALPTRAGLVLTAIAAGFGFLWGFKVVSTPGDGAIGGFLLIGLTVIFLLFAMSIVGLRATITKKD